MKSNRCFCLYEWMGALFGICLLLSVCIPTIFNKGQSVQILSIQEETNPPTGLFILRVSVACNNCNDRSECLDSAHNPTILACKDYIKNNNLKYKYEWLIDNGLEVLKTIYNVQENSYSAVLGCIFPADTIHYNSKEKSNE